MKNNFFITTPIYYTNGVPHIGHSYSSIIAQTISKYKKINGNNIKFSTGVDENSQKVLQKAQENNLDIKDYLDDMAIKHKNVWDGLDIEYTDFIRTTEKRHHNLVREVLQLSFDNGGIYEGLYEGKYCVGCESFKKDDELIEKDGKKVCPDHLVEPENIKEKNYFFRLSKYSDKLKEFYKNNPDFVLPKERFNEVISFVDNGLEDFSISRETNTFGIRLPFDETQVTYVWYDALFNYLTVCKNSDSLNNDMSFWPPDLHVVGKDIVRFHAIYWPAMLMSVGYELPKNILTTGYFTIDGQKISKSLGNVINPVEFISKYNKELLSLYLLDSFHIGQDGDFSEKQSILMYNAKLANNLGNLLNRVVVLSLKINTDFILDSSIDEEMISKIQEYKINFKSKMDKYLIKDALDITFSFLDILNKYTDISAPWQTIKDETKNDFTNKVLFTIGEGLRVVGINLYSFFPEKMIELFDKIGLYDYNDRLLSGGYQKILEEKVYFTIKEKGNPLFQKIDIE